METTLPTNTATSEEIVQKTSNTSVCQFILEWEEERRVCYHTLEQALREFLQSEPTLSSGQEYMKICQQVKVSCIRKKRFAYCMSLEYF